MLTTHIDTLREWFDNAEDGDIYEGDTFIRHLPEVGRFVVGVAEEVLGAHPDYRILARAPKPKPAWHDAVAVIARVDDGSQTPDTSRVALLRDVNEPGQWVRGYCDNVYSDELFDVTPLIEAKVTDEARDRVWDELVYHGLIDPQKHRPSQGWTADVVHAALGLETE